MNSSEPSEFLRARRQCRFWVFAAIFAIALGMATAVPVAINRRAALQTANSELLNLQAAIVDTQAQIRDVQAKILSTQAQISSARDEHNR